MFPLSYKTLFLNVQRLTFPFSWDIWSQISVF